MPRAGNIDPWPGKYLSGGGKRWHRRRSFRTADLSEFTPYQGGHVVPVQPTSAEFGESAVEGQGTTEAAATLRATATSSENDTGNAIGESADSVTAEVDPATPATRRERRRGQHGRCRYGQTRGHLRLAGAWPGRRARARGSRRARVPRGTAVDTRRLPRRRRLLRAQRLPDHRPARCQVRARTASIGLGRFYQRRARRLLPALALMLITVTAAVSRARAQPAQHRCARPCSAPSPTRATGGRRSRTSPTSPSTGRRRYSSICGRSPSRSSST